MGIRRLVSVDLGRLRLGVAVTDPATGSPRPLAVLARRDNRRSAAAIRAILEREQAEAVVVGIPLQAQMPEGSRAAAVRRFAAVLAAIQPRPVWLVDESGTSVEAEDDLRLRGLRRARRRRVLDQHAAACILARFLAGEPAERVEAPGEAARALDGGVAGPAGAD